MPERGPFEALLAVIDELVAENESVPIVVEGQRDVASLRELGCRGEIHVLHNGLSLVALAEKLARETDRVILLTDWDRKGGILFDQFATQLSVNSVRLHGQYRERLGTTTSPGVQDVESLAGYVDRRLARHMKTGVTERFAMAED